MEGVLLFCQSLERERVHFQDWLLCTSVKCTVLGNMMNEALLCSAVSARAPNGLFVSHGAFLHKRWKLEQTDQNKIVLVLHGARGSLIKGGGFLGVCGSPSVQEENLSNN